MREHPIIGMDIRYLAGLVDGDGSIFISRRNELSAKARGKYRLFLSIANVNQDLLTHLSRAFRRNIAHWQTLNYKAGHIVWEGKPAQHLIKRLLPHLIAKKAQAKLALKLSFPGRGRKQDNVLAAKLYVQMRELNRKWSRGKVEGART